MLFNLNTIYARSLAALALAGAGVLASGTALAQAGSSENDSQAIRIVPSVPIEATDAELEYWNDPDFRRRFIESYISETDLEPKPTSQEEIEAINTILETMSVPSVKVLDENGRPKEDEDGNDITEPKEETSEEVITRLQNSLDTALQSRENKTYSVLVDFLIANLYLNMAMNQPDVAEPEKPEADASEDEKLAYEQAFKVYEEKVKAREEENTTLLQAAGEYYHRAKVKHPKYRRAWRNYGLVQVRLKNYEEARRAFAKVIILGGGDPDTYGLMAFCYTNLGKHLPAESAYRMANMLDPDQNSWEMGMVRSFLLQERYPEAVALTGRLLKQDPTSEQLWLFQANAYLGMQQFDNALENYEILNGLGKSSVATLNLMANIYTNKGLFDIAVSYYRQAIKDANPSEAKSLRTQLLRSARVLSTRGESARPAMKKLIVAIDEHFGKDLEKKDRKELYMLKSRIAVAEGDDLQEAKSLEQVVQIDPLDGEALVLLGQFHSRRYKKLSAEASDDPEDPKSIEARNHLDQAVIYFERAQGLDVTNTKYEKIVADAYVRHAQLEVASGRPEVALPLLKKSLDIISRPSVANYLEAVERMSKRQG